MAPEGGWDRRMAGGFHVLEMRVGTLLPALPTSSWETEQAHGGDIVTPALPPTWPEQEPGDSCSVEGPEDLVLSESRTHGHSV